MNKKHLFLDDRYKIEEGSNEGKSFKKLALPSIFNNGHNNICKIKKDCVHMY